MKAQGLYALTHQFYVNRGNLRYGYYFHSGLPINKTVRKESR